MPPIKRRPAQAATEAAERPAVPAKAEGRVYRYEHLIYASVDSGHIPGHDTAAVMAAINAGERPNGEARVERTDDLGGDRTLVTWAVPVEAV